MTVDKDLFKEIKTKILDLDPVYFAESHLTLEGEAFRLNGNGFKPFSDIYRYIGIKALEINGKPVILTKGRQVGGTIMAAALEMYFTGSDGFGTGGRPPVRIMHAFPQLEMATIYSKTKLNPMIMNSKREDTNVKGKNKSFMEKKLDQNTSTNDSLSFKQFINGNTLEVNSIGIDADRIRGRSNDIIFFDEVQDMSGGAIINATKILAQSKYGPIGDGVQVYFGTPKKKGSDFYKLWEASNQQYYHLGCEQCEKFFPLFTPGNDDWEKVWLHTFIVKCTHCGCEQNKNEAVERGKWIGSRDENECKLIGFHINQLYMPTYPKERIIAEKPENHPLNTERLYRNEVLGEFFQGDSSPITAEEIREFCGDVGRKLRARIMPGEELIVTLGIDYGKRSDLEQMANTDKAKMHGQSYSTAVVLVAKGPNLLSIEYCYKFPKNDPESKKNIIDHIMRQYSIQLAIGDIGYSEDLSSTLHTTYGDKYIVSRSQGKVNDKVKFNKDAFPKEITFERDFYIGELFAQMKKGQIRFPYGDYEKIAWLVSHCSSMDIKPVLSKFGDPTIHYVKGSTPNDGLMSLLNAYIAYKFIVSNGFTTKNPLLMNDNLKANRKPLVTTGVITRRF
jgi:hypothetical protein